MILLITVFQELVLTVAVFANALVGRFLMAVEVTGKCVAG